MLTSLGKFLRKLRIDNGEILKNMSDKLDVSPSFLSAVENGKKKMPSSWNSKICLFYQLTPEQVNEFTKAIAETENSLTLSLDSLTSLQKEHAISFARTFDELSDEQWDAISQILKKGSTKNV
ncbi:helix-turn-helix transcriptional regulator [uncultured Dialister sp.]|uniref:helix-turn-helix domain-containing protein n=1 Tax=uncultured Dialister sp. TaxID=278064 RepID=UPI00260C19B4|nr:helix-turn-helix transcriptional regulator [uncultured Dialister sp.]